jgi:hypothetical protein
MEPSKPKRKSAKRKKSTPERDWLVIRAPLHVAEVLRAAATHHKVKLGTYLQWLLERAVKDEIQYYGWPDLVAKTVYKPNPRIDTKDMQKLFRLANRKRKKKSAYASTQTE